MTWMDMGFDTNNGGTLQALRSHRTKLSLSSQSECHRSSRRSSHHTVHTYSNSFSHYTNKVIFKPNSNILNNQKMSDTISLYRLDCNHNIAVAHETCVMSPVTKGHVTLRL